MKKMICSILVIIYFTGANVLVAQEGNKNKNALNKTTAILGTHFNINKISTWIYNNGKSDILPTGNSGLVYPKRTGKTAMFLSGLLWGGKIDGKVRVGGSIHRATLQPGKIISKGIAENPDDPALRVYRVRPGYKTAYVGDEIIDGEGTAKQIREQYDKDWNGWPADKGAPYIDIDGDGIYDPSIDVPGIKGAAQTLWYVANDLDSTLSKDLFGSLPLGIEVQVTVWGYITSHFDHMIFKKYKIINKSGKDITDMYISMWMDPDIGDSGDDFVGCDTLLNLAYSYNAYSVDADYSPLPPPAGGFALLQGPVTEGSPGDTAHIDGRIIPGKKNLGMTSFFYFAGGDPILGDPPLGNYHGSLQYYNFMQSRYGVSGEHFRLPEQFGGGLTNYLLPGDPVTNTSWVDGITLPPGDRRMGMASGPFNMVPADTQEVIFAEIYAGAAPDIDRLKAVEILKNYASLASEYNSLTQQQPITFSAAALDKKAILFWGDNANNVEKTESRTILGKFNFQGYNVYQYSSGDFNKTDTIRIATFDIIDSVASIFENGLDLNTGLSYPRIVQYGFNTGLQRYFIPDKDYLTGLQLSNGSKYYYAVTAYYYNADPDFSPRSLESTPEIITIIPHSPDPGVRYGAEAGTDLNSVHSQGNSKGMVRPKVIDPTQLRGHSFKVTFKIVNSDTLWDLIDNTSQTIRLLNQKNQSGDEDYLLVDGLLVKVINDKNNPNTPADVFTFTSPGNTEDKELAKSDVQNINVFPNPYYFNSLNENPESGRYVTFSHLPEKATIRIYDLAGWLVRTLEKDSPDQFYKFDLYTNDNTKLASGIYVAYIEMSELKTTKIVKFAIIQ